ncbi:prepilin peptidase [Alicycliphilus denitrificans]|uniref:Prepilin leader peptidase/N-methyltransferase n=2 Tax=Alicycliphilus denitrificans TaxID=179636 RepID=F4G7Y2_ALIDK|nr:A24 family peptidase [Alicycliphilus denitrificans]GAO20504.1 prepilin peptidase [Alicycliphilus sp. B1]ADU98681.1 Prepilin peptidase [Alicycliphilus denitrificans BC]AEB83285.1 Prepilin peptidase [Alicycliphilus denitrificans K601]QKD43054.1 prepilin peptidase [Alicycliphilus denitrificans]GAO26744.1 prepilin peptidase [Alicycliphilus sp. B1]
MTGSAFADAVLVGVLGLLIGSFLNVVIHRLPRMMERQWAAECAQYAEDAGLPTQGGAAPTEQPFNLLTPRSRCPSCGHEVRWYENIPVLSYLALRGRCSGCGTRIGVRYPLVELATAALFYACALRWGWSFTTLAWCGFCAALVALALIDWDTTLLPDDITLPLLWAGLLASVLRWIDVQPVDAVIGAAAGYVSLWLVYWGFKLATGKEGMGYGDFKLFAALGAWFGWQALVPIVLMASVIGALVGIAMKFASSLREGKYVPFGPFLAGGGLAAMLWGPARIMRAIFSTLGL